MSSGTLAYKPESAQQFLDEITKKSGQNLLACYQCRRCAAGCPVADDAGLTPDRLIRLIVMGQKEAALNNKLVWKCTACYTCGTRCPNNIQTARINEVLKHKSKQDHLEPLSPKVAAFHSAFMSSTSHFGRVNEMEFMGIYEMNTLGGEFKTGGLKAVIDEIRTQAEFGREMMNKKRMHFGFGRIKGMSEIKRLYKKAKTKKQG